MSSVEEAAVKNILNLLKLKNENPEDLSRDGRFLSAAFEFLQRRPECIWCQYTVICGELLRLFSFKESPPLKWFREHTISCLTSCRDCIESYYGIRPKLFASFRKIYNEDTVKDFEGRIHRFDVERLKGPFQLYMADRSNRKGIPIKFMLFEILLFPGWIVSDEIADLFEKILEEIVKSMKMVKITEKLPGVIICSVHPNPVIRSWAKSVIETDLISSSSSSTTSTAVTEEEDTKIGEYKQVNYSWDETVIKLSDKLDDPSYLDAMYVCIRASRDTFISTKNNNNWMSRVFKLLKSQEHFMPALRLFGLLLKTFAPDPSFKWTQIPEFLSVIESILNNSAFSNGSHTEQDFANFVLDWIPVTVVILLKENTFKIAHKLVSELMEFTLECRTIFSWKVKVIFTFSLPTAEHLKNSYLLSKMCQLLIFLFDKRFESDRSVELDHQILQCTEKMLISLIRSDFSHGTNDLLEGKPSSAIFDLSNYHKFCTVLTSKSIQLEFLNLFGKIIVSHLKEKEFVIVGSFWTGRTAIFSLLLNESFLKNDFSKFSLELITSILFINLLNLKLTSLSLSVTNTDLFMLKIIQCHPDKCLKGLTEVIYLLLNLNYRTNEGGVVPLDKSLYFINSLIGKVFEKDLEILSIYHDRHELILTFFVKVIIKFYNRLDGLVALPGGSVYYELSGALASFACTLLSSLILEPFFKYCSKVLKTEYLNFKLVPCLVVCLMNIHQRSNNSRYTDIPHLLTISCKFITLCGYSKVDLVETGKVVQILKVILSSSILDSYKKLLLTATEEYSRFSGKTLPPLLTELPKARIVISAPTKLDESLVKKLNAFEKYEEEFSSKNSYNNNNSTNNNNTNNGSSSLKPSSKLGQLRQELAREGTVSAPNTNTKKTRFVPTIIQKAPRMMTQADLIRSRQDSSDSEADAEITLDLFKDSQINKPAPHRSVKLIDIEGEKESSINGDKNGQSIGKPISTKAIQMQRDWQCAQRLHRYILSLNYNELNEKALVEASVQYIPDTFSNYDKYFQIFEPLLQLECRSQITQAKEESEGRLTYFHAVIQSISILDDFHEVVVNFGDDAVHRLFVEQDLLVGHPVTHPHSNHHNNINNLKEILGIVTKTFSKQCGFEVTLRFYMKGKQSDVDFQLLTRLKQSWKFAKLCNMITSNREFLALQNLPLYSCSTKIFQPKFTPIETYTRSQIERVAAHYTRAFGLNHSQSTAIAYALNNPNFFTLIQGPPGTGKTRTIEGFLAVLFGRPTVEYRPAVQCKRVMICAPSNAAIDEIVRRLKAGVKDSYGHLISLRMVRVGSIEMIHDDVKDISIDGQVEVMIQGHIAPAVDMLQKQRKDMADIKVQLDQIDDGADPAEVISDGKTLQELKNQLWQVKDNIRKGTKFIEDARQNLRLRILNEAQVICCTLSASGHEIISKIDGDIEMVIIDEACQAVELSALIPLQYGCKRAILVGDPNQLPPTVLSQMASALAYEQSLFQRIQKLNPASVQLLSVQYRMHPAISKFPSAYFYGGRLSDGPNVESENSRPWHSNPLLGPCMFYDIPGQEQLRTFSNGKQGKSMMNELEAKIISSLISLLSNSSPDYNFNGKIGIITPYKEQRRLISRELSNRFGPNILHSIEVSTVDGYQGQEKEIIIFSCVRTGEKSGGIGFLNDSRRLNVAITRAKTSLFLLGKGSNLIQNPLWRSLIENYKNRNIFTAFDSEFWQNQKRVTLLSNMFES